MRTVTFKSILEGVAGNLGMDPRRDLNAARAATLTRYINERVYEGWGFEFWPEWTLLEERFYRRAYDPALNVAAGDEVYFPAAEDYYQALRGQAPAAVAPAYANSGGWQENSAYWAASRTSYGTTDWVGGRVYAVGDKVRRLEDGKAYQCIVAHVSGGAFDATKFGWLTVFRKYVGYTQPGQTVIGEVKAMYRDDPRRLGWRPGAVGFKPGPEGAEVNSQSPKSVWVEFRGLAPEFTSVLYGSAVAYGTGDRVWYPGDGECYVALAGSTGVTPGTDGTKWQRVEFPAVLGSFVKRAAMGDGLKDQKQTDRGLEAIQEAMAELQDAADRALAGQGQFDTASVAAYGQ